MGGNSPCVIHDVISNPAPYIACLICGSLKFTGPTQTGLQPELSDNMPAVTCTDTGAIAFLTL